MTTFPIQRYDEEIVKPTVRKIVELGIKKGGEYAGDHDRLANFRRNAAAWGVTMEQVWGIYTSKHWDAIKQYVEDLSKNTHRERMEPLEGRVDDMIVYLMLFKAMLAERRDLTEEMAKRVEENMKHQLQAHGASPFRPGFTDRT